MSGFTKLDSALTASSVWNESDSVRIVWVTMLSLADKDGNVKGSVVGLAYLARKTLPETENALTVLQSPDPYSGRKEQDGRRVVPFEGGWHLVNHAFYREAGMSDEQKDRSREKTRERVKRYRALHPLHSVSPVSGDGDGVAPEKGDARGKPLQYEIPLVLSALQEVFLAAWDDFVSDRKERRKPVTSRAAKAILARLSEKPDRAIEAIRKMIEKGWTSFEWAWLDANGFKSSKLIRRENIRVPITKR